MNRMGVVFGILSWALGACLLAPGEVRGQSVELAEVRAAMDEGRFPQARDLLEGWWDDGGEAADRGVRQEALWLRALLTPDPEVAELDYRRLVIEFPGGPHSAGALLRLAQGAEARGEPGTARRYLEILLRDYPRSEHRLEARERLGELPAEGDPEPVDPGETSDTVVSDDQDIVEPDSIVADTVTARPAFPDAPEADSVPVDPTVLAIERADEERTGGFTVQLGAFSTLERAAALVERAHEAGLDVRIVQVEGSVLFRVRLGAWAARDEAEQAAAGPRELGFEALVSPDRELEHPPEIGGSGATPALRSTP